MGTAQNKVSLLIPGLLAFGVILAWGQWTSYDAQVDKTTNVSPAAASALAASALPPAPVAPAPISSVASSDPPANGDRGTSASAHVDSPRETRKLLDGVYLAAMSGSFDQFQTGIDKFTEAGETGQTGDLAESQSQMEEAISDFEAGKSSLEELTPPAHCRKIHRQLLMVFGLAIRGSKEADAGIASRDGTAIRGGAEYIGQTTPIMHRILREMQELKDRDG